MKWFLKMCDTSRIAGKCIVSDLDVEIEEALPFVKNKEMFSNRDQLKQAKNWMLKNYNATSDFFDILEDSQPFVFAFSPIDRPDGLLEHEAFKEYDDKAFDLPFKTVSFEFLNKDYIFAKFYGNEALKSVVPELSMKQKCLLFHETEPGHIDGYTLLEVAEGDYHVCRMPVIETNFYLDQYLKVINNQSCLGKETIKERVKIGTGQNKRVRKIKTVIHVVPKEKQAKYFTTGRKIDFSHRFMVRGHWRDIDSNSLGKNRLGNYCIQGKTWVTEHERGDKELPLIKKVRMVA